MEINEKTKEVLTKVGLALLITQTAEMIIRTSLVYALKDVAAITADDLLAESESKAKKTLGNLLAELRIRTEIYDGFDTLLSEFLRNRNVLAHHFSDRDGSDLHSDEGREKANIFLSKLTQQALRVIDVFAGLMVAWQEQVNLKGPEIGGDYGKRIREEYAPLASVIFTKKEK